MRYNFVGYYFWLRAPYSTTRDGFALGHDSTIAFDTPTSNAVMLTPYHDVYGEHLDRQTYNANSSNCKTDVSGVAYKFLCIGSRTYNQPLEYLNYPRGYITVEGVVTNPYAANIQVSYGSSTVNSDYTIADAVKFLTTGAAEFKLGIGTTNVSYGDALMLK